MQQLSVNDLRQRLMDPTPPLVLDVRQPWEAAICQIPGSLLIPMADLPEALPRLPADREIVVLCHLGFRSAHAVRYLHQKGFGTAINLIGGIHAWAQEVDPSMSTY